MATQNIKTKFKNITTSVFFEFKTRIISMIEICLAEVRKPKVGHLIDQLRQSIISRDPELVNEIKPRKNKFQQKAI